MHSTLQLALMAAVVTTMLVWPVGALLAWLCFALLDIPFQSFLTFSYTFNGALGFLVWWLIGFIPAALYAAVVLPPTQS